MTIKQNTANWVPVRLVDAADAPVTGLAFNAAGITNTFKLCKNGAAAAVWNPPSAGAWIEDGSGYYRALLAAGDCDTLGLLTLIAVTTTGQPWEAADRVESVLPADVKTVADAILVMAANTLNAALGRFHVRTTIAYNASTPDLATLKIRQYDNKAHADADDGVTGLVVPEFTTTISYSGVAVAGTAHQITKVVGS